MNLPTEIVMVLGGLLTEAAAKQIKLFAPKNLLAVDQAYTKLLPFGLTPNFVIGDCDSIDKNSLPPGIKLVERDDQDMTDFEKSIHFVREHSWKRVSIFGFGGGELDHILGNVEVLSKCFLNEDEFYFFDYFEDKPKLGCIIDKGITFNSFIGAKASLFPCPSAVLSSVGLKYEMSQLEIFQNQGVLALRNELVENRVKIKVHEGKALIIFDADPGQLPRL